MSTDDWDTDDSDDDWPEDDWDDDESLTVPCPHCKAEIYEDAERCPHCGEYVVRSSSVWEGKPLWWMVLGGVGILATIVALSVM